MASRMLGAWMSAALLLGLGLGLAMAGASADVPLAHRSSRLHRQPRCSESSSPSCWRPSPWWEPWRPTSSSSCSRAWRRLPSPSALGLLSGPRTTWRGCGRSARPARPCSPRWASSPGVAEPPAGRAPGPRVDGQRLPRGRRHRPARAGRPPAALRRARVRAPRASALRAAPRASSRSPRSAVDAPSVRGARHPGGTHSPRRAATCLEHAHGRTLAEPLSTSLHSSAPSSARSQHTPEPVLPLLADARLSGAALRRLIEASTLAGARSVELVGQQPHGGQPRDDGRLESQAAPSSPCSRRAWARCSCCCPRPCRVRGPLLERPLREARHAPPLPGAGQRQPSPSPSSASPAEVPEVLAGTFVGLELSEDLSLKELGAAADVLGLAGASPVVMLGSGATRTVRETAVPSTLWRAPGGARALPAPADSSRWWVQLVISASALACTASGAACQPLRAARRAGRWPR